LIVKVNQALEASTEGSLYVSSLVVIDCPTWWPWVAAQSFNGLTGEERGLLLIQFEGECLGLPFVEKNIETILSVHRNRSFRYYTALFKSLL